MIGTVLMLVIGKFAPEAFMSHFIAFALACFVGFQVTGTSATAPAHAADGGDRHDFGDRDPWRAVADRLGQLAGHAGRDLGPGSPRSTSSAVSLSPGGCSPCSRSRKGAGMTIGPRFRGLYRGRCSRLSCRWAGFSSVGGKRQARGKAGIAGMALAVVATIAGPASATGRSSPRC